MRKLTDLRLGGSCRRPHDAGEHWRAVLRCSMPQPRLFALAGRSQIRAHKLYLRTADLFVAPTPRELRQDDAAIGSCDRGRFPANQWRGGSAVMTRS